MRLAVAAIAVLLSTAPVFAVDVVTYAGMLGDLRIVAELTDPQSPTVIGRYSYLAKGGDIPLDAMAPVDGAIKLAEEAPCDERTCIANDDGIVTNPPLGAVWHLVVSPADGTLSGQWQAQGKAGKTLPIVLTEIGRRALPADVALTLRGLYDSEAGFETAGPRATPYLRAKMDVPLTVADEQTIDGSTIEFVTDPRSKFAFPRLRTLVDGSAVDAANAALAHRHTTLNSYAFDCLSQRYAGFGQGQYSAHSGVGTLGDYDNEEISVTYLSPTVMNWIEAGSTWCGGAYPNNHADSFIIDVRTGQPLALANIFNDWLATYKLDDFAAVVDQAVARAHPQDYLWAASQPLIDYVLAHRIPTDDAEFEAECGINALIATNLGLRFASKDRVVFTLEALPHAIFACGDDLLTVPLATIPQLLAPTASDYFPALAQ